MPPFPTVDVDANSSNTRATLCLCHHGGLVHAPSSSSSSLTKLPQRMMRPQSTTTSPLLLVLQSRMRALRCSSLFFIFVFVFFTIIFMLTVTLFLHQNSDAGESVASVRLLTQYREVWRWEEEERERKLLPRSVWQEQDRVQDVVIFAEEVLLVVHMDTVVGQVSSYVCVFRLDGEEEEVRSGVSSMVRKEAEAAVYLVKCPAPAWERRALGSVTVGAWVEGELHLVEGCGRWSRWDKALVYEVTAQKESVVLLVKNMKHRGSNKYFDVTDLTCVFLRRDNSVVATSRAMLGAQEVVHCHWPSLDNTSSSSSSLVGTKVSLSGHRLGGLIDSVAYFPPHPDLPPPAPLHLCACTMVWNKAKFLPEWLTYNAHLGVQRFFIYDNNSDDGLEEAVASSLPPSASCVTYQWPWLKTQQAAFSHCAVRARTEGCRWLLFADVDEYVYPKSYLVQSGADNKMAKQQQQKEKEKEKKQASLVPMLRRLIQEVAVEKKAGLFVRVNGSIEEDLETGEIRLDCHNFGPSGLRHHPRRGVTVAYTCRLAAPQRHKSVVRTDALSVGLLNVLHHFQLRPGFQSVSVLRSVAVVNHYKFQVWEDFKLKFVRRAGTYTTDWTVKQNEKSRDRTPGLTTQPIMPPNWHQMFCQLRDTQLKDYVLATFTTPTGQLSWQTPDAPTNSSSPS